MPAKGERGTLGGRHRFCMLYAPVIATQLTGSCILQTRTAQIHERSLPNSAKLIRRVASTDPPPFTRSLDLRAVFGSHGGALRFIARVPTRLSGACAEADPTEVGRSDLL